MVSVHISLKLQLSCLKVEEVLKVSLIVLKRWIVFDRNKCRAGDLLYLVFPFVLVVIKVVDPGIVLPEHNDNGPKIMPLSG